MRTATRRAEAGATFESAMGEGIVLTRMRTGVRPNRTLAGFRHAALGFSFLEAPIDGKWRACNSGSRKARCSADLPS